MISIELSKEQWKYINSLLTTQSSSLLARKAMLEPQDWGHKPIDEEYAKNSEIFHEIYKNIC